MNQSVLASDLKTLPFFEGLGEDVLEQLLTQHRVNQVEANQTLVMEADWGDTLMILLEGLAKVRTINTDGEETVLSLVGRGDLLGEMSLLDGQPRSADVVTLVPVRILKLNGKIFLRYVQSNTTLAFQLARLQSRRLRDANQRLSIQRSDATSRVLFAIAYLARKSSGSDDPLSPTANIPQGEIAILAGLARETSSRTMSKLRSRGTIRDDDGVLRIASADALRKRGLYP